MSDQYHLDGRGFRGFIRRAGGTYTFEGPPVTRELQQVFGSFAPGAVTGVIVIEGGIQVGYSCGTSIRFTAGSINK